MSARRVSNRVTQSAQGELSPVAAAAGCTMASENAAAAAAAARTARVRLRAGGEIVVFIRSSMRLPGSVLPALARNAVACWRRGGAVFLTVGAGEMQAYPNFLGSLARVPRVPSPVNLRGRAGPPAPHGLAATSCR